MSELMHHAPSCYCGTCRDKDGIQHPVLTSGILTIVPGLPLYDRGADKLSKRDLIPPTPLEKKERENCPACREKRYHSDEEWKNHPRRGTGADVRSAPHK